MTATFIVSVIAVFLAFLPNNNDKNNRNLFLSFLAIFIFLALRYDFGNDYMNYFDYFEYVQKLSIKGLLHFREYENLELKEVGFTWLNKLFPSFYLMVAVLSLFSCYVYFNAIKLYGTPRLIWFSVFIFLFDPYLMLVQSSAIRQTVAICLFIYSIKYLIDRKFLKYCLLILLASLFHKSALFLLPVYLLITPVQWGKWILIAIVGLYLALALFGYVYLSDIVTTVGYFSHRYQESYMTDIVGNQLESGFGFLFWTLVFLFIVWFHNKTETHNILVSKLSIIGFVISPLGIYINMFNRFGMYFNPFIILLLPYSVSLLKSRELKIIIVIILISWYLYNFYIFFQNPLYEDSFSVYKINLFQNN
jgi:hypothetical protein